jgi:hypothetical protein
MADDAPRSPDPSPRGGGGVRSILLSLAVIALFVMAAVFVAGLLDSSEPAGSLEAGDCLRAPDADQVVQVDTVDCAQPHELEVIGRVPLSGTTYPGDEAAVREARRACEELVEDYVGTPFEESVWFVNTFTPTAEGWEQGDQEATCLVFQFDPELTYLTVEGSARNAGN